MVEIKKDDYNSVTEQVVVRDKKTTQKTIILNPNVGTLIASCEGCEILLNGESIGKNKSTKKLNAGRYTLRAEKPNFYPEEKDVLIVVGEKKNISFDLSNIMGSASVFVAPIEAQNAIIYINKKKEGAAPKVFTLPIGSYNIKVDHGDFVPDEKKIKIEENKNQTIEFNLLSYSGSMQQNIDKWKRREFISACAMLTFSGVALYYNIAQGQAYTEYQNAATSDDAVYYKDLVSTSGMYMNISGGVAIATSINWLVSRAKKMSYQKKLKK